jgi:competence protein ComEC
MVASFVMWSDTKRPDVLVSDSGTLVGVMTSKGCALSKQRGAGFVARNWLENDGDGLDQYRAAEKWGQNEVVIHISGKRAAAAFQGCIKGQVLVSSVPFSQDGLPCIVHDPSSLRYTGSLSYTIGPDGPVMRQTARAVAGDRLWTHWPDKKPLHASQQHAQRTKK